MVFCWSTLLNEEPLSMQKHTAKPLKGSSERKKKLGMLAKGIVLLHDNARPHTAGQPHCFLDSFGREVLDHLPYSSDLAPNYYHPMLTFYLLYSGGILNIPVMEKAENAFSRKYFSGKLKINIEFTKPSLSMVKTKYSGDHDKGRILLFNLTFYLLYSGGILNIPVMEKAENAFSRKYFSGKLKINIEFTKPSLSMVKTKYPGDHDKGRILLFNV
ncbi:hypothetical protein QYM36_014521 [Artemia franciscana]|uniref:Histone-lysine N-methyltransferase SETMAR n=1 Tax=Artemia franciscana TaxID=6661 RepID=A0AA88L5P9_ARTSF|nr:hypothetical protein QYM36_014521 [Artemia franciscana]